LKQKLLHNILLPASFKAQLLKWLGAAMLAAWVLMAIFFVNARWLYADSAYTLFRVLNKEPLIYDRFSNLIQLSPSIVLAKLNMPASIILHSLNLTLPLLFILGWLWQSNKDNSKALIFPFLLWACGPQAFYFGYSEILLAAFFFGMLICLKPAKEVKEISWFWATCLLMFMSHPAAWLFSIPVIIYHTSFSGKKLIFPLLGCIVAAAGIQYLLSPPTNPYDKGLLQNVLNPSIWQNLGSANSLSYLYGAIKGWMWFLLPAAIFAVYSMFRAERNKHIPIMLIFWLFAFLIVLVIYHRGEAHGNMEKFFYPCIASVFGTLVFYNRSKLGIALFGVAFVVSQCLFIWEQCGIFCNRYQLLNNTCNQFRAQGKSKVLTLYEGENWQSVWALPYESMALSALQNKATVSIRSSIKDKWKSDAAAASDSLYLGAEFMPPWPQNKLNKRYFQLTKTAYYIDSTAK
jgi:hypothetical protein